MLGRFDNAALETIVPKEVITVLENPFWETQK